MSLLARLGAVKDGRVTETGRLMQRLPLQPRLARVLVAAHGSFEACAACARLSEPTLADLRHIEQNLGKAAKAILGDQYRVHVNDTELRHALLAGYPDRVARRRDRDNMTLPTGHGASIGTASEVDNADWVIALDVTSGRKTATTQALIREASRIEPEWLSPTRAETIHEFAGDTGTVKARQVEWYDELILREHPIAPDENRRIELLTEAWLAREPDDDSRQLLRRIAFAGLDIAMKDLVAIAARSARNLSDLVLTEAALEWNVRQRLDQLAPSSLTVPSGRSMTIDHGDGGSVSVSVKLQELFGLHLLAPNGRSVQTTQDLESFWERTYPEVRKELRGRYPRHSWPEDPWNAPPTHRTKKRSSQ